MTVVLSEPLAGTGLAGPGVSVEPAEVRFFNLAPGRVRVEVTVRNAGPSRSEPTVAVLSSAPLGAFVPWAPLSALPVPALGPGASTVLTEEVSYEAPAALGSPDRVPPRALLTALGAGEPAPRRASGLAPDIFQLVARGGVHWAGNLNVFVSGAELERHGGVAIRAHPGRTNAAMFVVGSGHPDRYAFELHGDAVAWDPRLIDATPCSGMREALAEGGELEPGVWYAMRQGLVFLAFEPRDETGALEVHVRQESTGRVTKVEFGFDPRAAGAGCYTL
ncbi:MAG TPA: hypothetical protein VIL46_18800 [Gemmataceae bacterium]